MRKFSKILSAFLALIMLLGCCVLTVSAQNDSNAQTVSDVWDGSTDTTWYDSESTTKTYTITKPEELAGLASLVNAGNSFAEWTITLGNDLYFNTGDASEWKGKNVTGVNKWTAIGKLNNPFKGTFDGNGHVISGLYDYKTDGSYRGLFALLDGATVINVSVVNSCFNARLRIGTIAGGTLNNSTIQNCYTNAIINKVGNDGGNIYYGGIVGDDSGSTIENCWFDGTVDGTLAAGDVKDNKLVGGMVGRTTGAANISNCLVTGSISGKTYVGGIAGDMSGDGAVINNCLVLPKAFTVTNSTYGLFACATAAVSLNNVYGKWSDTASLPDSAKSLVSSDVSGTYGLNELDTMKGDAAKTSLNGFDFDGDDAVWATVTDGTPVIKALAYVAKNKTSDPIFDYWQSTMETSGKYDARFIAIVDDYTKYDEIGFDIAIDGQTVSFNCWCVYNSILGGDYDDPYTAEELGGRYIVAVVLEGMSGEKDVTVTPWVKYKGETEKTMGTTKTATVKATVADETT